MNDRKIDWRDSQNDMKIGIGTHFTIGDYQTDTDDIYVITEVDSGRGEVQIVEMQSGRVWNSPVTVGDVLQLSRPEFEDMVGGYYEHVTFVNVGIKVQEW